MTKLVDNMRMVPNPIVRRVKDENNELVGIFFQDQRMQLIFEKFPEVMLADAAYKRNNRRMPIFLQLIIDGNGVTEIVAIWICKGECSDV